MPNKYIARCCKYLGSLEKYFFSIWGFIRSILKASRKFTIFSHIVGEIGSRSLRYLANQKRIMDQRLLVLVTFFGITNQQGHVVKSDYLLACGAINRIIQVLC